MSQKTENPLRTISQKTTIQISPKEMNDIRTNIKLQLEKKTGKCNEIGYIESIKEITHIDKGQILSEDLSANIYFKVEFNCNMYIPNQNTQIIGKVKTVNNQLITCSVGDKNQIIIFIPKENVSTDNFNINNNYLHYKLKKELNIDDNVLINLITIKVNNNDSHIKCIGYLNDINT
jgi:DNA-directed RNA polymerase subunit E'/Rpb7